MPPLDVVGDALKTGHEGAAGMGPVILHLDLLLAGAVDDLIHHILGQILYRGIQGKMIVLEVGTLIEAFFYTGNYIYKSDCTVKSRGKEGNIFTVELRPETALVKFQRREFYRLKCTIDADIIPLTDEERKIFDVTGKLPDNFVMPEDKGIIVDISGGGLRLFSKKQYDADSIVNVSFPIQVGDRSRYMKLMAKVVMSMRNQNSDSVYDSRLQFVNMQKEDTEDIVKYVFAQQRMIRKKERGL